MSFLSGCARIWITSSRLEAERVRSAGEGGANALKWSSASVNGIVLVMNYEIINQSASAL